MKKSILSLPRTRFSRRLFLVILVMLLLFAAAFVLFQQSRERHYRIELLNSQLQDYNHHLHESLPDSTALTAPLLQAYLQGHPKQGLRLTAIAPDGRVLYDSMQPDASHMPSHSQRREVVQALSDGSGYDINRQSETLGDEYFYSATYFPRSSIIIRTALPYNTQLLAQLQTDHVYLWFALLLLLVLIVLVRRFCLQIDDHILRLRSFAGKADRGESLDTPELLSFTDDELGEIAERIIVIYRRLRDTRQEQDRLKRELTQNVAHELKTPVASIQGYLDTILTQADMPDSTRRLFLERCFSQATRLTALLQDISQLNRLDANAAFDPSSASLVDIKAILAQVQKDTHQALLQQSMQWAINIPFDKVIVRGTEQLVYSIFRNLTDNAIAYAGRGATISVYVADRMGVWRIHFADNGVGVPPQHLPRLFERFYRVDEGRSRELGGTGLGLAIVKNSVLALGGRINVYQSITGEGLEFDIWL